MPLQRERVSPGCAPGTLGTGPETRIGACLGEMWIGVSGHCRVSEMALPNPGASSIKVPSEKCLVFMNFCVSLLEFERNRPTRDQAHFLFVNYLSLERPAE